jgi:acyl-CoA reductase-like NAD-dependent aldehyde dehydrogenase
MDLGSPFGGFKSSGIGREFGPEGLASFVEYQSIYVSADQLAGSVREQGKVE